MPELFRDLYPWEYAGGSDTNINESIIDIDVECPTHSVYSSKKASYTKMLRVLSTEHGTPGEFVEHVEHGELRSEPRVRYCRVRFRLAAYTDELYPKYKITLPEHISSSVKKRRAEYLAGRICCCGVLGELGEHQEVTTKLPGREPLWPGNTNGSISHCGPEAIAVATSRNVGWVGVDIEKIDKTSLLEGVDVFTTPEERKGLIGGHNAPSPNDPLAEEIMKLLITFSVKETLFKALYPRLQIYFGFECATVESVDTQSQKVLVRLNCTLSPQFTQNTTWTAEYMLVGVDTVVTVLLAAP